MKFLTKPKSILGFSLKELCIYSLFQTLQKKEKKRKFRTELNGMILITTI